MDSSQRDQNAVRSGQSEDIECFIGAISQIIRDEEVERCADLRSLYPDKENICAIRTLIPSYINSLNVKCGILASNPSSVTLAKRICELCRYIVCYNRRTKRRIGDG